jgi:hypothetical protein
MSATYLAIIALCMGSYTIASAERPASHPSEHSFQSRNTDIAPTEEELKSVSNDWLFHVQTTSCSGTSFDNTADSLLSRLLLPLLVACCVFAISTTGVSTGQTRAEAQKLLMGPEAYDTFASYRQLDRQPDSTGSQEQDSSGSQEHPEPKARMWHMDFARICAIMCVIFEHAGGEDYTHRNVIFGLWWALPYLYMTSGMGCMMSKKAITGYVGRLLCVFAVGVSANWVADVITGRNWKGDFGNTIFQMFFVIMLVIMAIVTEPLRLALARRRDTPNAKPSIASYIAAGFWGLLTVVALCFFMRSTMDLKDGGYTNAWMQYYAPIFKHTPLIVVQVGGALFLSTYGAIVAKPEKTGLIGWALLAFIYVPSVMIPWDQGSFFHLMNLYILAMVTTVFPLAGTDAITKWVRAYWPFLIMILCLASMPDMWGRCDVHPPYAIWERFRYMFGELLMIVCFVTSAFAPDDPYNITVWMGWWSLYAYCFHVMWYRLLGSPYGAVVTFGFIGVFYALHVWLGKGKDSSKSQAKSAEHSSDKASCPTLDEMANAEKGIMSA